MPAASTPPCSKHLAMLDDPRFQSAGVVEAVLRAAHASGMDDAEELDPLFAQFVYARLAELQADYLALFAFFWSDEEVAKEEFKDLIDTFFGDHEGPWPPTDRGAKGNGDGGFSGVIDKSALLTYDYRVGKTHGKPDAERRAILDRFFCSSLSPIVKQHFGDTYGTPRSEQRLLKMANVIAANCRNFKRNDPQKYSVAIDHYEIDLAYLKARYHRPAMFRWPKVEPF